MKEEEQVLVVVCGFAISTAIECSQRIQLWCSMATSLGPVELVLMAERPAARQDAQCRQTIRVDLVLEDVFVWKK
jgi:hypothetical protein